MAPIGTLLYYHSLAGGIRNYKMLIPPFYDHGGGLG